MISRITGVGISQTPSLPGVAIMRELGRETIASDGQQTYEASYNCRLLDFAIYHGQDSRLSNH